MNEQGRASPPVNERGREGGAGWEAIRRNQTQSVRLAGMIGAIRRNQTQSAHLVGMVGEGGAMVGSLDLLLRRPGPQAERGVALGQAEAVPAKQSEPIRSNQKQSEMSSRPG